MRFYSYLYHAALALFLLGISCVALASGSHTLRLDMLPWQGVTLTWWLFGSSLFGLVSIVLALKGTLRQLFFLWSAAVLAMMVRGFFFSSHFFQPGELSWALYLIGGALLAVVGAWFQMVRQRVRAQWAKARV